MNNGWETPSVRALTTLPNGDVVAAGEFIVAGGVSAKRIARWNGTSWSAIGAGLAGPRPSQPAFALTMHDGDLVVSGTFSGAGPFVSPYLARLTTACPASTLPHGAGCIGSGGANVLVATTLPWTGSTFRSAASGMPANGLAVGVIGFQTLSIPLASVLPQGVAGCTLLVSPDLLDSYVPTAGSVQTSVPIPNVAALVSTVFHQQVVPVEIDPLGIAALTSTNALTLTIGSF